MPLSHAILGFLDYAPMSGYDLKKYFDQSVAHFWSATQSHIYKALENLETDGLVTAQIIVQDGKPNRKEYQITPAGRAELHRWVVTPLPLSPTREAWLIQVFFSHSSSNEEIIALLQARIAQIEESLAAFTSPNANANKQASAAQVGERMTRLWMLTADYGISYYQAEIAWLSATIERVRQLPPLA